MASKSPPAETYEDVPSLGGFSLPSPSLFWRTIQSFLYIENEGSGGR